MVTICYLTLVKTIKEVHDKFNPKGAKRKKKTYGKGGKSGSGSTGINGNK